MVPFRLGLDLEPHLGSIFAFLQKKRKGALLRPTMFLCRATASSERDVLLGSDYDAYFLPEIIRAQRRAISNSPDDAVRAACVMYDGDPQVDGPTTVPIERLG